MALYYATVDQLAERFEPGSVELAWLTHEENGEVDTALATTFLEKGQDTIHEHLAPVGIDLPLDTSDAITESWAREITLDLAIIYLEIDNRQISEARKLLWDNIIARLIAIRDGNANVPGVDPPATDSTSMVSFGAQDATLVRDGGYRVSKRSAYRGF